MRADKYLSESFGSRSKAARAIEDGLVIINGKTINPSYEVGENDKIEILKAEESYVSMGGYKLAKALKDFGYSPENKIFADVGASTGGFTDCLLQNGAKKVYCIDVGASQLDERLKGDRVVVIDNFNARNLNADLFAESLDGAVIDVSFISLTYILGGVAEVLPTGGKVFALVKPQFECESRRVGKNGIVSDGKLRKKAVEKIYNFALSVGLAPQAVTCAPKIKGKNIEYVMFMEKGGEIRPLNMTNI